MAYASLALYVDVHEKHDTIGFFSLIRRVDHFRGLPVAYVSDPLRLWGGAACGVSAMAAGLFMWSFQDTLVNDRTRNLWLDP